MTDTSMERRVCIITGAASGMGRIAARELAKKGATIVMNNREIHAGQEARADIRKLTGNENIEFVGCATWVTPIKSGHSPAIFWETIREFMF